MLWFVFVLSLSFFLSLFCNSENSIEYCEELTPRLSYGQPPRSEICQSQESIE